VETEPLSTRPVSAAIFGKEPEPHLIRTPAYQLQLPFSCSLAPALQHFAPFLDPVLQSYMVSTVFREWILKKHIFSSKIRF
jgi:hypothetical protein